MHKNLVVTGVGQKWPLAVLSSTNKYQCTSFVVQTHRLLHFFLNTKIIKNKMTTDIINNIAM